MSKNIILATIYKLVFKHNTDIAYVGQSTNINSRFKQHIKNANDFSNIDNKLYFFMNLYGIHNFYIEVIEIFNNISQFDLHHFSFIFYYLVIWVILNHYFMYITLRISKIKIFQFFISMNFFTRIGLYVIRSRILTFTLPVSYFTLILTFFLLIFFKK